MRLLRLGGPLERKDDREDLQLASRRRSIPSSVRAGSADRGKSDALRDLTREGDAGGADHVANGSEHGHTAVLKLGVAEPHDGLVGDGIGDAKRVPDLVASLLSHTLAAQAQCRQPGERTVTWRRCVRVLILPDSELTGCALRAALSPCARPGRQQLRAHRVDERHLRDSHTGSASDRHNGGVDEGRGHERGDHHRHDQIAR
mmetsp:Transcript_23516/g.71971  ORF Transcript_23516/g.71971 Transcript_23516/m.71971 type:complete len:202 (-) Transcript_23516:54-659(-)